MVGHHQKYYGMNLNFHQLCGSEIKDIWIARGLGLCPLEKWEETELFISGGLGWREREGKIARVHLGASK